jgi:thioredoxin reductase (NADPH)
VWDTVVEEVSGNGMVQAVQVKNVKTGERSELATDGVFIYIGHLPNSWLFDGQLELDKERYLVTDKFMRTSVPGVFAAGEIQDSHFRQVATSVGQGCAAAIECERWLAEEEDRVYPGG